ncbi:hypothetical protein JCM15548_13513 [Geofilum rubicundum JCM 15548]|uniref:Uncharacterized protein n=1 Tax=Geofilum rubicundum JCM 15548 TaxID=1236989 RepID=A0A0E9M0U2_9BACT|nr:hypothetical protein JCM15548_13513 [Geofilum rubicundum JCM 15548]
MVGGKSKMKDWKAAARNWILNQQRFNGRRTSSRQNPKPKNESLPKLGSPQFRQDKDYDTPL